MCRTSIDRRPMVVHWLLAATHSLVEGDTCYSAGGSEPGGRWGKPWRKVRTPMGRMLANGQAQQVDPRGSAQGDGKWHRKQTARAAQAARARVKWRGKSSPRHWRQWWQAKPHPEQHRIGTRRLVLVIRSRAPSRACGLVARAVGQPAAQRNDRHAFRGGQNPAYRLAPTSFSNAVPTAHGSRVRCQARSLQQIVTETRHRHADDGVRSSITSTVDPKCQSGQEIFRD